MSRGEEVGVASAWMVEEKAKGYFPVMPFFNMVRQHFK